MQIFCPYITNPSIILVDMYTVISVGNFWQFLQLYASQKPVLSYFVSFRKRHT